MVPGKALSSSQDSLWLCSITARRVSTLFVRKSDVKGAAGRPALQDDSYL
ncbi:hypothetical protein NEUTE1DRAFT_141263 [Neurospora tetrasperma FGSC 2508]|uniref:Uncharacterized protein n=1 Tax=Neurospora tetrasperma (strain FGSC 2508 / ATCC MYA-4615 / P0657) TaxID=510951 RepID=F8MXY1_NEUT8|nr:uncharacterized protein NEUTE1DRAFT_141263 [Neurospora tetrasperma FGSC 2508]EGO53842.1 hypothetical protein NEUTE1DRAFT_141263 [Neurospora tetrasperma FGSC 2508]